MTSVLSFLTSTVEATGSCSISKTSAAKRHQSARCACVLGCRRTMRCRPYLQRLPALRSNVASHFLEPCEQVHRRSQYYYFAMATIIIARNNFVNMPAFSYNFSIGSSSFVAKASALLIQRQPAQQQPLGVCGRGSVDSRSSEGIGSGIVSEESLSVREQ